MAVSLSLVAGTAVVAPAQAAGAKPSVDPSDLAALASPPVVKAPPVIPAAGLPSLGQVAPAPSELEALHKRSTPSAFDPARSTPVDAETTPTRRVFNNPDGSHTAQLHTMPVRYQDAAGAWRDFDLTPRAGPDATVRATAAPKAATLGSRGDAAVATVDTAAGPIALSHPGVDRHRRRGRRRQAR